MKGIIQDFWILITVLLVTSLYGMAKANASEDYTVTLKWGKETPIPKSVIGFQFEYWLDETNKNTYDVLIPDARELTFYLHEAGTWKFRLRNADVFGKISKWGPVHEEEVVRHNILVN